MQYDMDFVKEYQETHFWVWDKEEALVWREIKNIEDLKV
jgi:hypothetical protein